MNYFDKKKTTRIEKLEKKLYSRDADFSDDERSELDKRQYDAATDWQHQGALEEKVASDFDDEAEIAKPKTGVFWTILIIAFVFFIGSIGYASYVFLGGQKIISGDDIYINIVGPVSVGGGDKLSIDVIIQNNSPVLLEAANLVIDYPDGTKETDLKTDLRHNRIDLGNIDVGSVIKKTLDMAFLGENGENKTVDVKVEYRTPGSTALFDKVKTFDIILSAAPVQLTVEGLEKISSGQTIDLDLDIKSNSEKDIDSLMIIATYPFGFSFDKASVKPTYGNNIWVFNNFTPSDIENIRITGKIEAQNNEERAFRFAAGIPSESNKEELGITLTNTRHIVSIEKPFIGVDLVINDSTDQEPVIQSGEKIATQVIFTNNTNNIVRDVNITLSLEGAVLDKAGIYTLDGFYSSFDNKISFNKNTADSLIEVTPRQQVNLSAVLKAFDLSINNRNLKNPELKISAVVTGRRVSESGAEEQIEEKDFVTIKVLSDLILKPILSHNSGPSENGFSDTGPIPPKVDQETTYTVTWSINNSTSNVTDTKVVGTLPSYVSWNGKFNPSSENLSYDSNTRKVTWNVGNLNAGIGYGISPRQASFQITLLPSVSQARKIPIIVDDIKISAFDTFTRTNVEHSAPDLDTEIYGRDTSDLHQIVIE